MNDISILEYLRAYAKTLDAECENRYFHKISLDTERQHSTWCVTAMATNNGWTYEVEYGFGPTIKEARDELRSTLARKNYKAE